jgi:hypothetical protein
MHVVVGGFTPGNTSFLVMNPDFRHLALIVMLKDVIKVSLFQKGQKDRIKNIVSVFNGIQCSLNNFELSATIMTLPPPKRGNTTRAA